MITTATLTNRVSHSSKRERVSSTKALQVQIQNLEVQSEALAAQLMVVKQKEDRLMELVENLQKAIDLKEAKHKEVIESMKRRWMSDT
jgi:anti-sigma28 factor (negative regulator of flagellin synthesis)